MRIRSAAVALALVFASGCTAPSAGQGTSTATVEESVQTSAPSTVASTSALTTPTTSATPQTSSAPSTSASTTVATATSYPGGVAGQVDLVRNGWLDGTDRLMLRRDIAEQAATDGPTLCSFVFGTVPEIAGLTQLPTDATLDEISGVIISDEALLLACVYDVGSTPALVLQIGVGPDIDPDLPGRPVIVREGSLQAVFSYAPGRSGLSADTARQWLTQAAARVAADDVESPVHSTE